MGCGFSTDLQRPQFDTSIIPSASWLDGAERYEPSSLDDELPTQQVVLIGPPGCGKASLIAQIREKYGARLMPDARLELKPRVWKHTLHLAHTLTTQAIELHETQRGPPLSQEGNHYLEAISSALQSSEPTDETWGACQNLWNEAAVQHALSNLCSHEVSYVSDADIRHFLDDVPRISDIHYVPSVNDILLCHNSSVRTADISYLDIKYNISAMTGLESEDQLLSSFKACNLLIYVHPLVTDFKLQSSFRSVPTSKDADSKVEEKNDTKENDDDHDDDEPIDEDEKTAVTEDDDATEEKKEDDPIETATDEVIDTDSRSGNESPQFESLQDYLLQSVHSFAEMINRDELMDHNVLLVLNKRDCFEQMMFGSETRRPLVTRKLKENDDPEGEIVELVDAAETGEEERIPKEDLLPPPEMTGSTPGSSPVVESSDVSVDEDSGSVSPMNDNNNNNNIANNNEAVENKETESGDERCLRDFFDDFDESEDIDGVLKYVQDKFRGVFQRHGMKKRRLRILCLNALDSEHVEALLFDVKRMIIHAYFETPRIILPTIKIK